jgi:hypothetical protein
MMRYINFLLLLLILSGCASAPSKQDADEQRIYFKIGYDGEIKPLDEVVTVVLPSQISLREINGVYASVGSNFRSLNRGGFRFSLFGTGLPDASYLLLTPGKTTARLYFNDGVFSAGDGFQKILFDLHGKAGDVITIEYSFTNAGRRGGVSFKQVDLSHTKEAVRAHFEIAKAANKDFK